MQERRAAVEERVMEAMVPKRKVPSRSRKPKSEGEAGAHAGDGGEGDDVREVKESALVKERSDTEAAVEERSEEEQETEGKNESEADPLDLLWSHGNQWWGLSAVSSMEFEVQVHPRYPSWKKLVPSFTMGLAFEWQNCKTFCCSGASNMTYS